ncbi:MAG: branched-chain amino acid ABC transporter permease [Halanaerobiales bacterium]
MSTTMSYFIGYTLIYILMTWSIYLPYRVKDLHFLNVAIMAITAYFSAVAAVNWGWPFYLILITAIFIGIIISFIISKVIADVPTFTVVIVGITFIFIIKTVIENSDYLGGTMGFFAIPSIEHPLLIMGAITLFFAYLLYMLNYSQIGRAASVIFSDKRMAHSLGIKVENIGRLFQTISSAMAGSAGVLYAYFTGSLFPEFFSFHLVGTLMTILFIGGYTTMWGVIPAAILLGGVPVFLPSAVSSWKILIYGVLLIAVILINPEGIITRKMLWKLKTKVLN